MPIEISDVTEVRALATLTGAFVASSSYDRKRADALRLDIRYAVGTSTALRFRILGANSDAEFAAGTAKFVTEYVQSSQNVRPFRGEILAADAGRNGFVVAGNYNFYRVEVMATGAIAAGDQCQIDMARIFKRQGGQ